MQILKLLCLLLWCTSLVQAAQRGPVSQDLASINVSHPFIFSISSGQLVNNIVSDVEIGLGGAKIGMGFGTIENNSFLAIKGVILYKWEEPFGHQFDLEDFIDQVDFPNHKFYYGSEAVMSSQGYRIAIGAYRIYDPEDDDPTDTFIGASIGLGF